MEIWKQAERLDRDVDRRDAAVAEAAWAAPGTRVVAVNERGELAADGGQPVLLPAAGGYNPARCWLLGRDATGAVFAQSTDVADGIGLRALPITLDPVTTEIAVTAIALAQWHAREPFCSRCGHPTRVVHAGFARHCEHCGAEHFPRHDPAMIVAVVDDHDRLLLAHQSSWAAGRYSVLAGFCEAGESLEQTVHREVREEVGIRLDSVRYLVSQPWPMPRSLMAAFVARATTQELRPDGVEITDARWMTRADLRSALAEGAVTRPASLSVSGWLIDEWLAGRLVA